MFGTTFIDWLASLAIAHDTWRFWRTRGLPVEELPRSGPRTRTQHLALVVSICSNLLMLGFFKYFNFGVNSYNSMVSSLGLDAATWHPVLNVVLPLGISFYTFQSLSYIIDVYRGDAKAMRNFIDFSCFVSMFPHLVAGPILQFSFLARQLEQRSLTLDKFARGGRALQPRLGQEGPASQSLRPRGGRGVRGHSFACRRRVGTAPSRTLSRSTLTSVVTPTWPSGLA